MDREHIEQMVMEVLREKLSLSEQRLIQKTSGGLIKALGPCYCFQEKDRLNTGNPSDKVYTKDFFSLSESPRLGCGVMEVDHTDFPWTLNYDEVDIVMEGRLTVSMGGEQLTAEKGEIIYIPKGSKIHFSSDTKARFYYVTYPADWADQ